MSKLFSSLKFLLKHIPLVEHDNLTSQKINNKNILNKQKMTNLNRVCSVCIVHNNLYRSLFCTIFFGILMPSLKIKLLLIDENSQPVASAKQKKSKQTEQGSSSDLAVHV